MKAWPKSFDVQKKEFLGHKLWKAVIPKMIFEIKFGVKLATSKRVHPKSH